MKAAIASGIGLILMWLAVVIGIHYIARHFLPTFQ